MLRGELMGKKALEECENKILNNVFKSFFLNSYMSLSVKCLNKPKILSLIYYVVIIFWGNAYYLVG